MQPTPEANQHVKVYDPLTDATQAAYRSFTGTFAATGTPVTIQAWVVGFQQHPHSRARYRRIERMFNAVDGTARAPEILEGIDYTIYRALPERTDLGGEFTSVWIATSDPSLAQRGAVLAQLNGVLVLVYSISELPFPQHPNAISVLEGAIVSVTEEAPEQLMAHQAGESDLIARLPTEDDLSDALVDLVEIEFWYMDLPQPD